MFITAEYSDTLETEYNGVKKELLRIEQMTLTKDYGKSLDTFVIVHMLLSSEHLLRTKFEEVVQFYKKESGRCADEN